MMGCKAVTLQKSQHPPKTHKPRPRAVIASFNQHYLAEALQMSELCIGKSFTSPFSQTLYLSHSLPFSPDIEFHPTAQPSLDATSLSAYCCNSCNKNHLHAVFSPRDPPGAPRKSV